MPFMDTFLFSWNSLSVADAYKNRFLEDWANMTKIRKPIIAAVSGYAVR